MRKGDLSGYLKEIVYLVMRAMTLYFYRHLTFLYDHAQEEYVRMKESIVLKPFF